MKKKLFVGLIAFSAFWLNAQQESGLPGDHFSLEGAVSLFKESKDMESFEKKLNQENNYVNNLDLNQDGEIDYIRVEDHVSNDAHAIVLQAVISRNEVQDVAVIEIEQTGEQEAVLQIIGDEDVYGENVIVEPFEEEVNGSGNKGPNVEESMSRIIVNVWGWPSVRFIYRPIYRPWISPWRWAYYPTWWKPWRPRAYSWIYPRRTHFHAGYHVVYTHRVARAHRIYTPVRNASLSVRKAHSVQINQYRQNNSVAKKGVISQSSKTRVVTGPNGGKVVAQKNTTTVAGKNANGNKAVARNVDRKVVAKKGDQKAVVSGNKKTAAAAGNNRTGVAQKKTKTSVRSNGKKTAAKKSTTKRAARRKN